MPINKCDSTIATHFQSQLTQPTSSVLEPTPLLPILAFVIIYLTAFKLHMIVVNHVADVSRFLVLTCLITDCFCLFQPFSAFYCLSSNSPSFVGCPFILSQLEFVSQTLCVHVTERGWVGEKEAMHNLGCQAEVCVPAWGTGPEFTQISSLYSPCPCSSPLEKPLYWHFGDF